MILQLFILFCFRPHPEVLRNYFWQSQGTIKIIMDRTCVDPMKDKLPISCTIAQVPMMLLHLQEKKDRAKYM